MKVTKIDPPFALQVEPVEGCTLACWFCGLQQLRKDNGADAVTQTHGKISTPYRFMDIQLARTIAESLKEAREIHKWNPRVEFAMHGEPTMHPHLADIVQDFREYNPKTPLMVTTNGSGVTKAHHVADLFTAGLDTLAIDDYEHAKFVAKIEPWIAGFARQNGIKFYRYPANPDGNPHKRVNEKRIVIINDIAANSNGTHTLTNQGGNSLAPLKEPLQQRCAKPFREMSIRYDGRVAICCDDWKGDFIAGDVNTHDLHEIWLGQHFEAARRALYAANRGALKPCNVCDVRTYRNGLLPDKMGKKEMPALDTEAKQLLNSMKGKR